MDSPSLAQLLGDSKTFTLEVFPPLTLAHVERRVSEKNGRPAIRCLVRDKLLAVKPEEIIRQLWLEHLHRHYKYPLARLAVEFPITFGRDSTKRADIVNFDADRPTVPYAIIEIKAPSARDGKDQLKSYTHATGAPLALWSNGVNPVVWHRKNPSKSPTCRAESLAFCR